MRALSVDSVAIRREVVANWRAVLQSANTVVISSIALVYFLSAHAFDLLAHLNPVLSRRSQAFVQFCSIVHSREMGVWRTTTVALERWGESVHREDAAHAEEFGMEGNDDGMATGRELTDTVAMLASTPSEPVRLNSVLSTGCVRCRRLDRFGVVEAAVVDGQTAILGLGEHIRETMVPQYLLR